MRRLTQLLVWLIIGASINLAVAWACALWAPLQFAPLQWPESRALAQRLGATAESAYAREARGFGLTEIELIEDPRRPSTILTTPTLRPYLLHYTAGWPLRSFSARSPYGAPPQTALIPPPALRPRTIRWFKRRGSRTTTERVLPLRPEPVGLVANTILYAGVCVVACQIPRYARNRWRARRNVCQHCGYPCGAALRCTECGRAH